MCERLADGRLEPIEGKNGNIITEPAALDLQGRQIIKPRKIRGHGTTPDGRDWVAAPDGSGIWVIFDLYDSRRFSALKLP